MDVTITGEELLILTYTRHSAIEQWEFIQRATPTVTQDVYNGHLRGPESLTPIAERLAVEL